MKLAAAFLLGLMFAAMHAPLAAASFDDGMDCCAGGMTEMCCPLPGTCSMRSCQGDEQGALLTAMSVFVVTAPGAPMRPASSDIASPASEPFPFSRASRVLDPPPRG